MAVVGAMFAYERPIEDMRMSADPSQSQKMRKGAPRRACDIRARFQLLSASDDPLGAGSDALTHTPIDTLSSLECPVSSSSVTPVPPGIATTSTRLLSLTLPRDFVDSRELILSIRSRFVEKRERVVNEGQRRAKGRGSSIER